LKIPEKANKFHSFILSLSLSLSLSSDVTSNAVTWSRDRSKIKQQNSVSAFALIIRRYMLVTFETFNRGFLLRKKGRGKKRKRKQKMILSSATLLRDDDAMVLQQ